eukprot:GFUD01022139.1.p2 GENE.GFUD01022139.1~~GFUD01022139.1.p2  ORF type:complete len:199 (+),score=84.09 GFUD01022139.1:45-641(+)
MSSSIEDKIEELKIAPSEEGEAAVIDSEKPTVEKTVEEDSEKPTVENTVEEDSEKPTVENTVEDGDKPAAAEESNTTAAKKKNKKKKKKDKPTEAETAPEKESTEEPKVLGEISGNATEEKLCAFCKKAGPIKRCSKRHAKCLPKLFCNETCEALAHEDKKAAVAKKEASKVAAAKNKGTKVKNWKNTDSGQFWWHDQ